MRHPRDLLERFLRVPALSPGWRRSFEALLNGQEVDPGASGNAGLTPSPDGSTAAPGVSQRFRVVGPANRECTDVVSLLLAASDGQAARRCRSPVNLWSFVCARRRTVPTLLFRSYSLSGSLRRAVSGQHEVRAARRQAGTTSERRPGRDVVEVERTERQLHVAAGRRCGRAAECRNRRDARAGDAARIGRSGSSAACLVVARHTQRRLHSFAAETRGLLGRSIMDEAGLVQRPRAANDRPGQRLRCDWTGWDLEVFDEVGCAARWRFLPLRSVDGSWPTCARA